VRAQTLILDFDGTLTPRDADVVIAEAVLGEQDPEFIAQLFADYEALRLTTLEYFQRYLARLRLSPAQLAERAARVPLRPGWGSLLRWCEDQDVEVHVASEGLDVYIEPVLGAAGVSGLSLFCNRAQWDGAGYRVTPDPRARSCQRCLSCKGALVRRLRATGRSVVLVGNGASDLCGAREADQVLARDTLAEHCAREAIAYVPWSTLEDVREALIAVISPARGEDPL
jgi:2-hydroxy-3-keto-5-methylthiopentenyl-1-phosphate phosphatase